jgi:hypothetical protein
MKPLKFEKVMGMQPRGSGNRSTLRVDVSGILAADQNFEVTAGGTKKDL